MFLVAHSVREQEHKIFVLEARCSVLFCTINNRSLFKKKKSCKQKIKLQFFVSAQNFILRTSKNIFMYLFIPFAHVCFCVCYGMHMKVRGKLADDLGVGPHPCLTLRQGVLFTPAYAGLACPWSFWQTCHLCPPLPSRGHWDLGHSCCCFWLLHGPWGWDCDCQACTVSAFTR